MKTEELATVWKTTKTILFVSLFSGTLCLFGVPDAGHAQSKKIQRISVATGGTGGTYYPVGGGIANLISTHLPGVEATAEVTAAGVDNIKLLGLRKAELGLAQTDYSYDAYAGIERFKATGKIPLRALAMLYPATSQITTVEGAGINTVLDLKGKRVSTGAAGSGSEVVILKIFEAVGLDPNKDIRRERLSVAESVAGIKDRKLDAFYQCGGLPTASVLDLASTPGFKVKLIQHDQVLEQINKKYGPTYYRLVIPKGTYPGMAQDVPVIATGNLLVCHEGLDEGLAYGVVRVIFEHMEEFRRVHKEVSNITLQNAVKGSAIPFHPGAVRYYKEKKVWP